MHLAFVAAAEGEAGRLLSMNRVDLGIVAIYFAVVLGIGFYLKRFAVTGEDFFMAGRGMTAWIAGLSFISANLGSLEMMGWSAAAYQYGALAGHAYLIGAIPAILVLAIVMMPFYYMSKTHSVPGYLKLRFGEGTRALSGISFAVMTVLMSGINMYAMALVMKVILGWDIHFSIWVSSLTVAVYVALGGLLSAIFNEVLQFFLIWLGALLIPVLGLVETGGWSKMVARVEANTGGEGFTHLWRNLGSFTDNPAGAHWFGLVFGLGLAISFGYWCTDFLVVQRVMAAKDLRSAKLGTVIGAGLKMCVLLIVTVPGLLGRAVLPVELVSEGQAVATGAHSYNEVLPLLMGRYLGPGLLGLGVTALIAGFMSGMAGNVSAFATVWTHDIYRPLLRRQATDAHYVRMGRWCALLSVFASIGAAYFVMQWSSIIIYVQALATFFLAPLFGTVMLGMLWKGATPAGGFWGLLAGTAASIGMFVWTQVEPRALGVIAFSEHAKDMAENWYRGIWTLLIGVVVTVVVSQRTKAKPEAELEGLVYGLTAIPPEGRYRLVERPVFWAGVVAAAFAVINVMFW